MKKMRKGLTSILRLCVFTSLAVGLFASCQKEIQEPENLSGIQKQSKQITFEAISGEDSGSTRTVRNEDGSLSWLPNDEISVFCGDGISGRFISDNTEISDRTTFTGHFNTDIPSSSTQEYWAVYPYSSNNSCDGSSVTITVPSVQVSSPGTFGAGMFPSVARSNNSQLAFYNVCGLIKFSLSRDDIDLITLSSNGDELLAGKARVTFGTDGKPVAEALEGSGEIALHPSSGGCFEKNEYYYFSVLPVTLAKGFTISFHTIGGEEGILESNNHVTIKRAVASKKENLDGYVTEWREADQNQDLSETGVYLGILAFNQALYTCPICLLTPDSINECESFIDGLQMKNGTILYYAADQGLSNMQQGVSPTSLTGASMITFTDGLDQGSLMMNPDYETEDKYLSAVSSRIRNGNVFGLPLSAFSIGIRGNDVQNTEKFRNNLVQLASSEANAYEISDISELNARFEQIAGSVSVSIDYSHDISLTIPGLPDGTRVRFTFDNVSDASNSNFYIEGTFNLQTRTLSNVQYSGLTSRSGSMVNGTVNDIFVRYNFQKVRRNDGKELSGDCIQQWQFSSDGSNWQKNSEFDSNTDTDLSVSVSRKSSIVYLVLDCSSSLGNQFGTMKQYAKNFIRKLYNDSYIETSVQSVKLSASAMSVKKGETAKLSANVYPATALDRTVTWSSDNSGVATVSPEGIVTGISAGSTYIRVRTNDGSRSAYCQVTVFEQTETSQGQASFSQSGLYVGVMAFNQGLYRYPICRLTENNVETICSFIDNNPVRNGSLVYYSVDEAISDIAVPDYPSDLSNAVLITFTDCLDQGSLMKRSYTSNDQYLSAIKQRIGSARVESLPLTAYSIGIRGSDVSDISGYKANLEKLASSGSNAYEITNISSLQSKLNDIADVVSVEHTYTYSCNLTVTIPGVGNGTRVRFTFDNVSDAADSQLYIEGTFNLSTRALTNIVYKGFSFTSGSTVSGSVDGIFVTYQFNGLQKSDNSELTTWYMKEWTSDNGSSSWQVNSEFDNNNDASTEVSTSISRKSAVVYLVLDFSTSIGSQSSSMKSAAKNFLRNLQQKSYDPTAVSGITLSQSSWRAIPGMTVTLSATVLPESALDKSFRWESTNTAVATVSSDGVVTAVGLGACTIVATTNDGGFTANCEVVVKESLYDAVDLGLSVKWASCNVGAMSPEEYGDYYAWGETSPKIDYSWETYKWCNGSANSLTKYYNSYYGYGTVDTKTQLDLSDDAARANWGGKWRMPTNAEQNELLTECTWTWTTQNGVNGYRVTSKQNGNSIFLPAAGFRDGASKFAGSYGFYWSSTLQMHDPYSVYGLYVHFFRSGGVSLTDTSRCFGLSVRPVYDSTSVLVSGVSLDMTSISMMVGDTHTLTETVTPSNATDKLVTWSSNNTSAATVSSSGVVTAKGVGSATITVTTDDGGKKATCSVSVSQSDGPWAVDLGLSVKWASFNLLASKPEEYGDYYAWGETSPKIDYSWETYKWCNDSYLSLTKYNTKTDNGRVDNKTQLELSDDAARSNWGGKWRMPTDAEWTELCNNCTWTWTTQNGVNGYRVTSKENGNSIFLPAAGSRYDFSLYDAGSYGFYWSSTLDSVYPSNACYVYFYSRSISREHTNRSRGQSVRPVYGDSTDIPVSGVSLDKASMSMTVGDTQTLMATVTPSDATDKSLIWSSNNTSVATVSSSGLVTAKAAGTATITVITTDGSKTATCSVTVQTAATGTENGFEWVDMGLLSGLKWATCNVGASSPEEYGDYFAWGETEPKSDYSWETYKWCNGSETSLTKYNTESTYGTVDNNTQLEMLDDTAHANWGGKWRMPTNDEWIELRNNCTWKWTTQNGVNGRMVTSRINGNSIFFPAAGRRYGTSHYDAGSYGDFWSSTLYTGGPYLACGVYFRSSGVGGCYDGRNYGRSVRPVCD